MTSQQGQLFNLNNYTVKEKGFCDWQIDCEGEDAPIRDRDREPDPKLLKGYIDEKFIRKKNGTQCGPYYYLRWWDGKRHRSKYLGKKPIHAIAKSRH